MCHISWKRWKTAKYIFVSALQIKLKTNCHIGLVVKTKEIGLRMTFFRAEVKQNFAISRSPFFQLQLPKQNQASTREGFSLTCKRGLYTFQKKKLHYVHYNQVKLLDLQTYSYSFEEMIRCFFTIVRSYIQYLSS